MSRPAAELALPDVLAAYDFGGRVAGALRYGRGHINDTFAVYTQQADDSARRFLLQRINTHVFQDPDALMENILGVTHHLRNITRQKGGDPSRETLTVLPTREGTACCRDAGGGVWRVYLFIENAICHQVADTPQLFEAAARAFGNFSHELESYPAHTLHETIPKFHDTRNRVLQLKDAVAQDPLRRAANCRREIEFALERACDAGVLMDRLDAGELPLRVTHNDTKLNNILMDPATPRGVCVIDLDTVMPGLAIHDFGDAVRYGANSAREDEKELDTISFSLPLYRRYAKAYLETAGPSLTSLEKELLPWAARMMTYECGIRFLADYLLGDVYFHTGRPGQNLDRCRTQFKLLRDMEQHWQQMNEIIQTLNSGLS